MLHKAGVLLVQAGQHLVSALTDMLSERVAAVEAAPEAELGDVGAGKEKAVRGEAGVVERIDEVIQVRPHVAPE